MGTELLELGKSPRTNLQNEDLYFRNSSTIFGVEGPEDKETMGDPFPDEGCTALTAYLTKKTRRRPKIAGQPFRATYDLFLQPECLSDFQSFAGAGWEQTMLVGTVVQCPSKKNGYKFKVDWCLIVCCLTHILHGICPLVPSDQEKNYTGMNITGTLRNTSARTRTRIRMLIVHLDQL